MKKGVSFFRSRRRGSTASNGQLHLRQGNFLSLRKPRGWIFCRRPRVTSFHSKIFGCSCLVWLGVCYHAVCFYRLMERNLIGNAFKHELKGMLLDPATGCPALSTRITHLKSELLVPMTKDELDHQIGLMVPILDHTSNNLILKCPRLEQQEQDFPTCRGIVKVFRSAATYHHIKYCLNILQDSHITARLLYSDDESLTLVEEELALSTLWDAPIPRDFNVQLQFIRCILLKHSMVHRDFTSANFMVHQVTGKVYVIDFSDAFIWDDQWNSLHNLVNLFNIWWKWYDEDAQRLELVEMTKTLWNGNKRWKRPVQPEHHEKWQPTEEDLKVMGHGPRFDLLQDIHH